MVRTEPIIAVNDVEKSSKWYRTMLNCRSAHPGSDVFDKLVDEDGTVLLCLHRWGDHNHPSLTSPEAGHAGNGLLLFFRVSDFKRAWERAQSLPAIENNPYAGHEEFTVRDGDGYYVTICSESVYE